MMNYVAIAHDLTIAFVSDPRQIMESIQNIRPDVLIGVPRFYEKLHTGILEGLDSKPKIIRNAVGTARRWKEKLQGTSYGESSYLAQKRILCSWLDQLLLSRLRNVLGGKVKFMVTGSAPTPMDTLRFFNSIGVPLLEAYGLSENTIPIAANRPGDYRFGSVGKPFAETAIRIADDNEILIKGPGVFRGYFRDDASRSLFRSDGFLPTGDVGYFDEEGYLYLTGRKSDFIKTSTGRRIAPAPIEAVYCRSRYVEHVMVVGDGRKHLAALVTLSEDKARNALGEEPDPHFVEQIQKDFDRLGSELPNYARIRRIAILATPFRVSSGELTSSLKLRRSAIAAKYSQLIESLFADDKEQVSPTLRSVSAFEG